MKRPMTLLAAVALVASVAGCVPPGGGGNDASPCAELPEATHATADGPRTVVLVDVSSSTRSANAEQAMPDYAGALSEAIGSAVGAGAWVWLGSFGGPTGVTWTVKEQPTASQFENPSRQERQRTMTTNCLTGKIPQILATPPSSGDTDILAAIRDAAAWLDDATGPRRLVVATDGLVTTGCASLVHAGFADDREIENVASVCLERSELVANELAGVDVEMVGIGYPAPDQPTASAAQLDWLRRLWEALCQKTGASCTVKAENPGRAPGEGADGALPADGVVGYASGWRFVLPNAALFDTDQAALRSDAQNVLSRVAVQIRTLDYASVAIYGHADERGDADHNLTLSQQRADSVMAYLASQGLQNITSYGRGETEPVCTESTEDCWQRNRRVEIVAEQRGTT